MASSLDILIIGAGISGLTLASAVASIPGVQVTVLESKDNLRELGAGIQMSPNGSRLMKWLGLKSEFDEVVTKPARIQVLRYDDVFELDTVPLNESEFMVNRYGAE